MAPMRLPRLRIRTLMAVVVRAGITFAIGRADTWMRLWLLFGLTTIAGALIVIAAWRSSYSS